MKTLHLKDTVKTALLVGSIALTPALFAGEDGQSKKPMPQAERTQTESSAIEESFRAVDQDSDGKLSEKEAKKAGVKSFETADKNSDGEIDRSEFYLAVNQR